jgi:hypothetical protein
MRTKLLALLTVAALGLAATAPVSLARTATKKKFTGEAILLGTVTGTDVSIPPNLPGVEESAKAAAKTLNAKGGVTTADGLTHEVKISFCNTRNDKPQTAQCARDLIDAGVDAVVSGAALYPEEIVPALKDAGIPYFSPILVGLGAVEMTTSNSFVIYNTATFFIGAAIELAKAGYTKTAAVYVTAGKQVLPAVQAALESEGGHMAKSVEVPAANPNWASIAADAVDGTDSILVVADEETATPFIAAVAQTGAKIPVGGPVTAVTDDTIKVTGGKRSPLVGAQGAAQFAMPQNKAWSDYRASMKKYAPNTQLETISQNAWLSVIAIASVISEIDGTVDAASVMAQLGQTTDLGTFGGKLAPGIDLTQPTSQTLSRAFNPYYWGPVKFTAKGMVDGKGATFHNGFDILIEALGI